MFQTLSELTTYFIHQVIEESEEINEFDAESRPLVCASFMRLYSALCYVERYSHELHAELYAISKRETHLINPVIRLKKDKLFASIENFNFQLLNLEYIGSYHIQLLHKKHSQKAVWHYPDEWRIDVRDWIDKNFEDSDRKRRYAIYPFILTSPTLELSKQIAILKYPTKIPTATMQAEIVAELPVDMVDLKVIYSSNKLTFGRCVNKGASGAYEYILSGEDSCKLLIQSIYNLLEMQEIDLRSTTLLELLVEEAQPHIEAISISKQALNCFIKQNFKLDEIVT